jgi:hypothetical protein
MIHLKWSCYRGVTRGKPIQTRRSGRRLMMLGLLIASGLLQTGCQSGPFSPCGFMGRTTSRLMRPFRGASSGCCGSEIGSEVPIESVAPGVIVSPGATVIPGPGSPSNVSPSPADSPTGLEAIPQAAPGPAQGRTGSRTPAGSKTSSSYDTLRPGDRLNRGRGDNMAHTLISTPVPTARSAQDSAKQGKRVAAPTEVENPLDHRPPLDLPSDVTEGGSTPPTAPAAERKGPAASTPANDHLSDRSPREAELTLTSSTLLAPEPESPLGGAPGINRFAAVDLKLAGGSAPSSEGLNWLVEKGYKTLLDLRETSEANPSFIAEAANRGLRYISFPMNPKNVDRDHLARFNFELSVSEARPLYFFDSDGSRAGVLWYIRRITLDKVSSQIARREAEQLGLSEPSSWLVATSFIDRLDAPLARRPSSKADEQSKSPSTKPTDSSSDTPKGGVGSDPPAPTQPLPKSPSQANRKFDSPALDQANVHSPMSATNVPQRASDVAARLSPSPAPLPPPRDLSAWKPFAALVVTGLTLPLAYWTGNVVPAILAKTRASLPGPGPRPKSLPRA